MDRGEKHRDSDSKATVEFERFSLVLLKMTPFLAFSSCVSEPGVQSSFVFRHQEESFQVFFFLLLEAYMWIRLKLGTEMSVLYGSSFSHGLSVLSEGNGLEIRKLIQQRPAAQYLFVPGGVDAIVSESSKWTKPGIQ